MASKRRYHPIRDEEKVYHTTFDNLRMSSVILNSDARIKSDVPVNFNSRVDLKILLQELEKKQESTSDNLLQVDKKQAKKDELILASGRPQAKPSTQLRDEKFKLEATEDVLKEECEELNKLIHNIGDLNKSKAHVLKRGPQGSGVIKDGVLSQLDGQLIAPDSDGILCIKDKRSIYDGIPTTIYYQQIQKPWIIAKGTLEGEKIKLKRELNSKGLLSEFTKHWDKRREQLFTENPSWEKLFSIKINGINMPDPKIAKQIPTKT